MKYYLISVLEYRFGIIPVAESEIPEETDFDFEPIFLFPSLYLDFEIRLRSDKANDKFYVLLALSALKKYFFEIRSLPLEEIEICHSVSSFKLKNDEKNIISLPKSKQKFAKSKIEILGCELEYITNSRAVVFCTENIDNFDERALDFALLKEKALYPFAIVYSLCESDVLIKRRGELSSLESALIASEILSQKGEFKRNSELVFDFSFAKIKIRNLGNNKIEAVFCA